jgi:hypothetical protein
MDRQLLEKLYLSNSYFELVVGYTVSVQLTNQHITGM